MSKFHPAERDSTFYPNAPLLSPEDELALGRMLRTARLELWRAVLNDTRYVEAALDAALSVSPDKAATETVERGRVELAERSGVRREALCGIFARTFAKADRDATMLPAAANAVETLGASIQRERRKVNRARDQFVVANIRLVIYELKRSQIPTDAQQGMDAEDLKQEGMRGLLTAVDRYNPDMGNRFSTFAIWWIRHAIHRSIANNGTTVRVPVYLRTHRRRWNEAERAAGANLGRPPTDVEIAAHVDDDLDADVARNAAKVCSRLFAPPESLDVSGPQRGFGTDEKLPRRLTEIDPDAASRIEQNVEQGEAAAALRVLFTRLPERERVVLAMRYGLLLDSEHLPTRTNGAQIIEAQTCDIVDQLGVCRERVRQLEIQALAKLKQEAANWPQ